MKKVEICDGSRPLWSRRGDLAEYFDDDGTIKCLSTLIGDLEQRTKYLIHQGNSFPL